jgi:hypothetical protein
MSPHYVYTSPQELRVEGTMPIDGGLRLGDEINIKLLGREYTVVVVEIGVRDNRGYWVAEAKA